MTIFLRTSLYNVKKACPLFCLGGNNMSVEINVTREVVTAYLGGEIDHHTA